jgi:hypothetical protein
VLVEVVAIVAGVVLRSSGLSIVEFRRVIPLAFRCRRCGAAFGQAPHRDFPRACPRCRARDWAV